MMPARMHSAYAWIRRVPQGSGISKPDQSGLGMLAGTIAAAWRSDCIAYASSLLKPVLSSFVKDATASTPPSPIAATRAVPTITPSA